MMKPEPTKDFETSFPESNAEPAFAILASVGTSLRTAMLTTVGSRPRIRSDVWVPTSSATAKVAGQDSMIAMRATTPPIRSLAQAPLIIGCQARQMGLDRDMMPASYYGQ